MVARRFIRVVAATALTVGITVPAASMLASADNSTVDNEDAVFLAPINAPGVETGQGDAFFPGAEITDNRTSCQGGGNGGRGGDLNNPVGVNPGGGGGAGGAGGANARTFDDDLTVDFFDFRTNTGSGTNSGTPLFLPTSNTTDLAPEIGGAGGLGGAGAAGGPNNFASGDANGGNGSCVVVDSES